MANFPMAAQIAPVRRAVSITASATAFDETRGVFINTSGDFVIQFADASSTVTQTLVAGTVYPYCITKCTSGTGLWALY